MKTDKELYRLFAARPDYLFECAGIKVTAAYKMKSVTFKEFERRSDGLLEPLSDKEPVYIAEFQAYEDKTVYHRLIMEMAVYGKEHPDRNIRGILVFTCSGLDPKTKPWHELTASGESLKVVYLDDFLDKLEKKHPDHPLVAVFSPLRIGDREVLRKNAGKWRQDIEKEPDGKTRENFVSVFTRWMQERFSNLTYEEVISMFAEVTPLEETVSYKEIFAKGATQGKTEGKTEGKIEGKIEGKHEGRYETIREELDRLLLLRLQNILSESLFEILSGPLKKELEYLEILMDRKNRMAD